MATDRKHVGVYLDQGLYEELDRLRQLDRKKPLTMSKYAGRVIAEYVSRERWRLREKKYSEDSDFE
jgi:metal-responsive CopG/Arc/MetJ family transcriptional regulator